MTRPLRPTLLACLIVVSTIAADDAPRHWAYVPPVRPPLPEVRRPEWARNPIDRFVLARLDTERLRPSPEAPREKLLRRAYLDLIGLPPTVGEVDAFLADHAPDAYERVVARLLDSPAYGEKWATPWLDLARYADSNGYQRDGFRDIWAYRDWVIDALNADLPYDRFTVEQIAGDLLPGATTDQFIATGFNRNTTVNVEAGTDPEEDRYKQVVDRVNTTATAFLGTTLECAQCHDHKYDPFTQADYFRFFAYFNNTPIESKRQGPATLQFESPEMPLPISPAQDAYARELEALLERVRGMLKDKDSKIPPGDLVRNSATLTADIKALRPTVLVMREMPEPRATHIMKRGDHLSPLDRVTPGTPSALPAPPIDTPANRLALARWLTHPDNPLTSRVAVNRWWAEFFGHGLVATAEDFGKQGERPTHPELLDFLAVELVENGWSIKHIHRLIVTSTTYRQDSRISPDLLLRDPGNRLYARGPRIRMSAETVRDHALAAAGLLSNKMHGPPVFPPQPPDIWRVTGFVDNTYRTSTGDDRYRRGVYTVRRRSGPYPSFSNFDAPDRAACVVQRSRGNTPLQALTLMNDEVYTEAAGALATRVLQEEPSQDPRARITRAFRLVLARHPTEAELQHLLAVHAREGDAAWFHIATILLNLDEAITKG